MLTILAILLLVPLATVAASGAVDATYDWVITTSAPCVMVDWNSAGGLVEEMLVISGCVVGQKIPCLCDHAYETDKIRGSWKDFRLMANEVLARLYLGTTLLAAESRKMIEDGDLQFCSVGYRNLSWRIVDPHKSITIDGLKYSAGDLPLRVVEKWSLEECSLCVFPADPLAKITSGRATGRNYFRQQTGKSYFAQQPSTKLNYFR